MTSRERVLLAINHKEPDRLPLFEPNLIQTCEPFDEKVQHFLDTFELEYGRYDRAGSPIHNPQWP